MNTPRIAAGRESGRDTTIRWAAYVAAGAGPAALATAPVEAGIITIDVGPSGFNIAGVNAGLAPGTGRQLAFPNSSEYWLGVFNNYSNGYISLLGLAMGPTSGVAFNGAVASPRNFSFGEIIDAQASFTSGFYDPVFRLQAPNVTLVSPDFGPHSFIGFRSTQGSYGWLEVTWDQATAEFQILSGAYESEPGVGIRAGQVPEPATGALVALVLGGAAFVRWRTLRAAKPAGSEPASSPPEPAAPPAPS